MRSSALLSFSGLSALGLALAAGCGDGSGSGGSGGTGTTGGPGTTSSHASSTSGASSGGDATDITGTARSTWLTEAGEISDMPEPTLIVSAIYQKADKTFDSIDGEYNPSTGNFVIQGVPPGPYYLQAFVIEQFVAEPTGYFAMTARTGIDLGRVYGRRVDAKLVDQNPTNLVLDVTSMTAWQLGDMLKLFSLGAPSGPYLYSAMDPTSGDTSLMGFSANLYGSGLIDGAKGDKATLTHLTQRAAGNVTYASLGQVLQLPSITLQNGQPTKTGGAFQDVPQTTVALDWRRAAFEKLVAEGGQGASMSTHEIGAYLEPGGKGRASQSYGPTLFSASTKEITDVKLSVDYGNPFPVTYGAIARASVSYSVAEKVPGQLSQLQGTVLVQAPIDALVQGLLTPEMSPPTSVTISDLPVTIDLTGVGNSPVITWKAPKLGTPTYYKVRIVEFVNGPAQVADLYTTGTSVTVPSGFVNLKKGVSYAAVITAATGIADLKAPYRRSTKLASADALTLLFSP